MTEQQPVVTQDPRFLAGRKLVQQGLATEGAIDMFATLVEETTAKYGDNHIEAAPVYYEYGNALLRASSSSSPTADTDTPSSEQVRSAAAAAAEQRLQHKSPNVVVIKTEAVKTEENDNHDDEHDDCKSASAAVDTTTTTTGTLQPENNPSALEQKNNVKEENDEKEAQDDGNDNDPQEAQLNDDGNDKDENDNNGDLGLALEMMENAFSIYEEYRDSSSAKNKYPDWIQEQMPRVLLGIGDALSALERHADAADAYARALEWRQQALERFDTTTSSSDKEASSIEQLQAHRRVCEATILIAEALLACPADQDVITTETSSLIVTAKERMEYIQGYYDKARDALQETVFCMGSLASRNVDVKSEKEDVCFLATLVMGVGTTLAGFNDDDDNENKEDEPPTKKIKK